MLPASRIEWLTGRAKYEISSMTARTGRIGSGAAETQNRLRNPDRHRQEHAHREDGGDGDVARRGEGQRQQAEEVREHDEQEQGHDVGEVPQTVLAGDVLDHLVDEAVGKLGDRLGAARDQRAAPRAHHEQQRDADDGERHPQRHIGDGVPRHLVPAEQRFDQELVHRVKDQPAFCAVLFSRHVRFPLRPSGRSPRVACLLASPWRCGPSSSHPPRSPAA